MLWSVQIWETKTFQQRKQEETFFGHTLFKYSEMLTRILYSATCVNGVGLLHTIYDSESISSCWMSLSKIPWSLPKKESYRKMKQTGTLPLKKLLSYIHPVSIPHLILSNFDINTCQHKWRYTALSTKESKGPHLELTSSNIESH